MKNLIIILAWLIAYFLPNHLWAQENSSDIQQIQYYYNTDPGAGIAGNGGIIDISSSASVDQQIDIPLPLTLEEGIHQLYIRVKDENNRWGIAKRKTFYIQKSPDKMQLTRLQYFFNADPGVGVPGNGEIIELAPTSQIDQHFTLNVPEDLDNGVHQLYVRSMDQHNRWSVAERSLFFVHKIQPGFADLEYYYDLEPTPGLGTPMNVDNADAGDKTFHIGIPNLPVGEHSVFIRAQGIDGQWRIIDQNTFVVTAEVRESKEETIAALSSMSNEQMSSSSDEAPLLRKGYSPYNRPISYISEP